MYSRFSLFMVFMFYQVAMNSEFTNTKSGEYNVVRIPQASLVTTFSSTHQYVTLFSRGVSL